MIFKQLQCTGERALRQTTLWRTGSYSFLQLPEVALLAPLWYILHTNKCLDQAGFVVFRPYFNCIFWFVLSWQRGGKDESQFRDLQLIFTECWKAFFYLLSVKMKKTSLNGVEDSVSGLLLFYPSLVFRFHLFLVVLTLFFLSDSCLSHSR